jgi:hypothetical protein
MSYGVVGRVKAQNRNSREEAQKAQKNTKPIPQKITKARDVHGSRLKKDTSGYARKVRLPA